MAFLDNSGDIILDAVLTDAGRKRLARGDGTFKVTKYAFGDDEIDYASYNPNAASGSAYYDLEILQTPILEAFTNNRATLKSKLLSVTNNSLLYLPELVINEVNLHTKRIPNSAGNGLSSGSFLVIANSNTYTQLTTDNEDVFNGKIVFGYGAISFFHGQHIRVDQGLNTNKLDPMNQLSSELMERQYMIQMDNRLGTITDLGFDGDSGGSPGSPSFIDDDQIATYYVTMGVGSYIELCKTGQLDNKDDPNTFVGEGSGDEVLQGPRGTKLRFGFRASSNLLASDYLFDTIGRTAHGDSGPGTDETTYGCIDTTVKVTGVTTGYSIDIPVTFAKKTS